MTPPNPPSIPPQAVQLARSAADRIRAVYGVDSVRVVIEKDGHEVTVFSAASLANEPPAR